MSSAVFDKLFGRVRRDPAPDVPYPRPQPSVADFTSQLDELASEVARLRAEHRELEARCDEATAPPLGLSRDTSPGDQSARIEGALSTLHARCAELTASQTAMAAALRRADDAMRGLQADVAARLTAAEATVARDRSKVDDASLTVRELRASLATATQQIAATRSDVNNRSDEFGRRVAARLGPLYLLSLIGLLVSLGSLGFVIWRTQP